MPLQFHRPLENMDIWSASRDGFSFVISFESPTGPGFHGSRLHGDLAPALPKQARDQDQRLAVPNHCRGRGGLRQGHRASGRVRRYALVKTISPEPRLPSEESSRNVGIGPTVGPAPVQHWRTELTRLYWRSLGDPRWVARVSGCQAGSARYLALAGSRCNKSRESISCDAARDSFCEIAKAARTVRLLMSSFWKM